MLCKHRFAIAKTLVCYQHCLGSTEKPQHHSAAMGKHPNKSPESAEKFSVAL